MSKLDEEIKRHWQHLRGRTYELLDVLEDADLSKQLPFPASETLTVLHTVNDRVRETLRNIYKDASGKYFKVLLAQI